MAAKTVNTPSKVSLILLSLVFAVLALFLTYCAFGTSRDLRSRAALETVTQTGMVVDGTPYGIEQYVLVSPEDPGTILYQLVTPGGRESPEKLGLYVDKTVTVRGSAVPAFSSQTVQHPPGLTTPIFLVRGISD